jgi:hypothetical protein
VDAALLRRCCRELKDQIDRRGIRLRKAAIAGTLDLTALDVPFPLRFDDCEFDSPPVVEGAQSYELALTGCARLPGLLANGVQVRRDLDLSRSHVTGAHHTSASTSKRSAIWLCESEIGGRLLCVDTVIDGGGERSIQADRMHVIGNIRLLHQFTARGEVRLIGARIDSSLDLAGASVESALTGLALDLGEATTFLTDDPSNWPPSFVISGFTYDRFGQSQDSTSGPAWDHIARCAWLDHQAVYDAGPYEQAARVFRQHGYPNGTKAILIAQRRRARQAISGRWALPRRALDAAFSGTVGYGYRPGRVLWLLAALLILVTGSLLIPGARATMRATTPTGAIYTTHGPLPLTAAGWLGSKSQKAPTDACGNGEVRCFNPLLYAVDTVIPLVSLDQRSTWYPDAHAPDGTIMQWWLNAATVLGWLLSSIFVLSLASLARSM